MTFWIFFLFSYNGYQDSAVAVVPPCIPASRLCLQESRHREGLCDSDRLAPDFSDDFGFNFNLSPLVAMIDQVKITVYKLHIATDWQQQYSRMKGIYLGGCLFGCLFVILDCYHLNNDQQVTLTWTYVCEDVLAISFWSRGHSIVPWVDYVHIFSAYIIR